MKNGKWQEEGKIIWYLNGKKHREEGPAIEWIDDTKEWKEWWINGKRHREDGPAIEHNNGANSWYQHGLLHREDGPAVEHCDGHKEWFLKDKKVSEDEFDQWKATVSLNKKLHITLASKPTQKRLKL